MTRARLFTWIAVALGAVIATAAVPVLLAMDTAAQQAAGLGIAVAGLVAGGLLFRRMNTRLMRLADVARAIGEGDYDARSDDDGRDAIGLLGRTLNSMGDQIRVSIDDLDTQRVDLEAGREELRARNAELADQYRRQEMFGHYLAGLNTVDINTLAERFAATVERVCEVEFVLMYVADDESGSLSLAAQTGLDPTVTGALVRAGDGGLARRVLETGELRRLDDVEINDIPAADIGVGRAAVRSVLAMPVTFQSLSLGVVVVAGVRHLAPDVEAVLKRHVDALASALNNAVNYKTIQLQSLRLEQVNMELVEADRLRSEFVANMSHELRTPLNSIIGFSGILQKNRDRVLGDRELQYAEKINRNGKHLLGLINDILDLSKIESGRMELEIVPAAPGAIIAELVDMLHVQAEARGLALDTRVDPGVPEILVDANKLKQVLINLVSNAIKFTETGSVTVAVEPVADGERIAFAVNDTGIGIREDQLEQVFEAFRQVDSSTTRKYGGTGLGLAISRAFVERMGGTVRVASRIGEGSTFTVELPVGGPDAAPAPAPVNQGAPAPAHSTRHAAPATASAGGHRRILIVDDDPDARDLLASYLKDMDVEILLAADGEQAIEMATNQRPDLITLDLMMPGLSGWDVLDRLKADEALASIPVVVISIVAETRKAAVLGAVDAITKPVSQERLQQVVERSLGGDGGIRQARILVVDDEEDARDLLTSMLGGQVGEVRTAVNGREALAMLEHWQADLVILDLMMPVMDGVSFLRVLRSDRRFTGLPVVILTAKQLGESERRELALRVAAVVQKGEESLPEKLIGIIESAT